MLRQIVSVLLIFLSLCSYVSVFAEEGMPQKVVVGIIPSETEDVLRTRYARFINHLAEQLKTPVELYIAPDYKMIIDKTKENQLDIAYYGPNLYAEATEQVGLEPVARALLPDGSEGYHSVVMVLKNSGLKTIADLQGKRLSYSDPDSTSGKLIPSMYFYLEARIDPETYFSRVSYAGNHEKSILALKAQEVDVIGVSETILRRGYGTSWAEDDFFILWRSQMIYNSLFAYRRDLSAGLKAALRAAILSFRDKEGLAQLKVGGFVPAKDEEYDFIRKMNAYQKRLLERRK